MQAAQLLQPCFGLEQVEYISRDFLAIRQGPQIYIKKRAPGPYTQKEVREQKRIQAMLEAQKS